MQNPIVDELMEGADNKYLLIGFDHNQNLIEVIYTMLDTDTAKIFHAMRCRNEYRKKLEKRGYHANFD